MPWKETTTMEQKIEFICEWNSQKIFHFRIMPGF